MYRIYAHPPVDSTSLLIHNGIEIVAMLSCLGNSERKNMYRYSVPLQGFVLFCFMNIVNTQLVASSDVEPAGTEDQMDTSPSFLGQASLQALQ